NQAQAFCIVHFAHQAAGVCTVTEMDLINACIFYNQLSINIPLIKLASTIVDSKHFSASNQSPKAFLLMDFNLV
ncbi:MAG: hypothetical protein J6Q39_06885, partial [Bacteroidales bacterium]|nr:hypothetical protein [Bacteroidales bacterium]